MYNCYHFNSCLVIIRVNKAVIEKKFCCFEFLANPAETFQDKNRLNGN